MCPWGGGETGIGEAMSLAGAVPGLHPSEFYGRRPLGLGP
jgi:hypothetical protein